MSSDAGAEWTPARTWPSFAFDEQQWEPADDAYGPRAARRQYHGPYRSAVPAQIAHATLILPAATVTLVSEASAEIARFDGEARGPATSFAALLLRTEAASSSQIEDLTSSAKAIALAELGRTGRANADEIVANVATMTAALHVSGRIDADAILEMHRTLMGTRLPQAAGRWRDEHVWIGGVARGPHGADYIAPAHELVPAAIDDLIEFISRDDLPPLAQAAVAHAQFENIHPFIDGNGRTGRALLHAMLRSSGLVRHSIVPVSAGLLANTGAYFGALVAYRDGDPAQIVDELAAAVFPAVGNSREMLEEIGAARERWEAVIRVRRGAAAWRLADLVTTRPVVDAKLVARTLEVTGANAQIAIDRLVEAGVLEQIGNGARNRSWQAPDVIAAMEGFAARTHRRRPPGSPGSAN